MKKIFFMALAAIALGACNSEPKFKVEGEVSGADGKMLSALIEQGIVPVVAPLTHDGKGNMLNINADTMAAETAKALAPYYDVTLTYCFDFPGVMRNPEDATCVIPESSTDDYRMFKEQGIVSGGMIPKIDNAFNALNNGVKKVIITRADSIDGKHGTHIML